MVGMNRQLLSEKQLNKYYGIEITINSDLFDLDTMSDHLPVLFKTGIYN
jgi:hypothetical protein